MCIRDSHGAVKLLVGGAQVHQQFQDLVDDFLDAGVGAVDLVAVSYTHLMAMAMLVA